MPEKPHKTAGPAPSALRFDLSSGPYCISCSKNIPAEACALQCIAERSAAADPGGDLSQRLRLRVRCLEKELASLTAKRSDQYARSIKETEDRYKRLIKQKDEEQSLWYAAELEERRKLRAGACLMYNINMSKRTLLANQMEQQRKKFEDDLTTAYEENERCKASYQAELEQQRREHAQTCSNYEAQVGLLERKKDEAEEMSQKLQDIVDGQRKELGRIKEERDTQAQEIMQLQQQFSEADKTIEQMQRDTRIKAIERRARQEKEKLEAEIIDYVKYILCTPEGRSATPDFPWEWLGNSNLTQIATERKRMPVPPSRPSTSMGFDRRAVSATCPLPMVDDIGKNRASSATGVVTTRR